MGKTVTLGSLCKRSACRCTLKCLIKPNKPTKSSAHFTVLTQRNTQNTELGLPVKLRHGRTEFSIYLFHHSGP